uniref:Uncharacterized protein n=1 Tax=Globodera rostochiensis TaxID=31243 RepID=A0A914HKD7_GLORO
MEWAISTCVAQPEYCPPCIAGCTIVEWPMTPLCLLLCSLLLSPAFISQEVEPLLKLYDSDGNESDGTSLASFNSSVLNITGGDQSY